MKTSYEVRAPKTAKKLIKLFSNCVYFEDFEETIDEYNYTHVRQIRYSHGVSRIAVFCNDYVIKFNLKPQGRFSYGQAGNIDSEKKVYEKAVADGMAHLLAKTTVGEYNGVKYAVMPKIGRVWDESRRWQDYCTEAEKEWLNDNLNDLHPGNLGYRNGKVCVIDYAWDKIDEPWLSSDSSDSSDLSTSDYLLLYTSFSSLFDTLFPVSE